MKAIYFLIVSTLMSFSAIAQSANTASGGKHDASSPAILISHDKVAAALAKGGSLFETNNFKIQAGRRQGPGQVEIHTTDTDIFYILEGTATFVTGGKALETKTTAPGEIRGSEVVGGQTHHLSKGDVIVIPNGVPHQFKETSDPFLYYVVKVQDAKAK